MKKLLISNLPSRREILIVGGAIVSLPLFRNSLRSSRKRPPIQDRHHRLGPYRRHARHALGEGRAPGAVLLSPSGRTEETLVAGAGPNGARRHRRARRRRSATSSWSPCPTRRCPQVGRDYAARLGGQGGARCLQPDRRRATATSRKAAKEKGVGTLSQEYASRHAARARVQHARLPHSRHRSPPARRAPGHSDRGRRRRGAAGRLVPGAGCRLRAGVVGPLARASDFAQGRPGYGKEAGAPNSGEVLGLSQ